MRIGLKGPGKCVFCEGGAVPGNPMTREHLWSAWMTDKGLLPGSSAYVEFKHYFRGKLGSLIGKFDRERQGGANTKTVKAVCKKCNSEWMSALETSVQPYLIPLMQGEAIVLDDVARLVLTQWMFMKILVAEHNSYRGHPADPIYSQAARTAFMNDRTIPEGLDIWIGRQFPQKWRTAIHRHAVTMGVSTSPIIPEFPPSGRAKNMQAVTWGISRLSVYFVGINDPAVIATIAFGDLAPLVRLWPLDGADISWPPPGMPLPDAGMDQLTKMLGAFLEGPSVLWAPDAHDVAP
jgi:hypothetical protein